MEKLVIYVNSLSRGGAEHVSVTLAEYMVRNDKQCIILTEKIASNEYDVPQGVERISLDVDKRGSKYLHYISNILCLRKKLKEIKPDKLLIMDTPACLLAIPATLGMPIKVIVSERNDPNHFHGKAVVKLMAHKLMKFADGFVFQTEDAKNYYAKSLHNKGVIIYNPLHTEKLPAVHLGARKKQIVSVGRLSEQKNQKMMIEAFAGIEKKYPEYELVIYGEGHLRAMLEKQVIDYGMEEKVKFPGNVADVLEKIKDAGIFVLSSDYEGMPNALIEAMALGIPVISTDCPCGGPGSLIKPYVNGQLFEVGNKEALINCMEYYIKNEAKALEFGKEAMAVRNILEADKICQEWDEYISNIN